MFTNLLRKFFDVRHSLLPRIWGSLLILVLSSGLATEQQSVSLAATPNSGSLTVSGSFSPYESVAQAVVANKNARQLTTSRDVDGNFHPVGDTSVTPGTDVRAGANGTDGKTMPVNPKLPNHGTDAAMALKSVLAALSAGFTMLLIGVVLVTKPQAP